MTCREVSKCFQQIVDSEINNMSDIEEEDTHHPVLDLELGHRFLTSCRNGDTWHVSECLACTRVSEYVNTGMMEAARAGQAEVVDMLISRDDCDINYTDKVLMN